MTPIAPLFGDRARRGIPWTRVLAGVRLVRRGSARRGFTLMEMLVAVGAVAIITVGIAAVFSAIGKTVSGGKRISQLSAQAAQIETVMRKDFARMSRDGFLMIRQQMTNTGGAQAQVRRVSLGPTDANPARGRRIDEVLFFAKGEFASSREPAHPSYQATSRVARIYYGHGTRQPVIGAPRPAALTDYNTAAGWLGQTNTPNQYAGDWTLVRHQCLLVDPRQTIYDLQPVFGLDPSSPAARLKLSDKEGQVALQPAALSVFRHLSGMPQVQPASLAAFPLNNKNLMLRTGSRRLSSGLCDIVTTSLREVRDVVTSSRLFPRNIGSTNWYSTVGPDPSGSVFEVDGSSSPPFNKTFKAQAWMDSAWPTQSDQTRTPPFEPMMTAYGGLPLQVPTGGRMRVEPAPPFLMEVLRREGNFSSSDDLTASDLRVDQLQLASHGFLRACSEFIVDWSFGEVDPATSELVWYGLSRFSDLNGNGVQDDPVLEPMLTRPYPFRAFNDAVMTPAFTFPFVKVDGSLVQGTTGAWASSGGSVPVKDRVLPELIYGPVYPGVANAPIMALTSHFGYEDTTGAQGRPWAWPEFVRVTLRLVDPLDSSTEQTFQFVFKTPGNGVGGA
ncbi:MAG: type II secretion system protein [Phycisphaeraceae bacterium]|nr:type II secretion system protein [Phycisphaerae bacterium]MBX3391301.1 type II secretion system protein [Phycisphaeraceae bacterium]